MRRTKVGKIVCYGLVTAMVCSSLAISQDTQAKTKKAVLAKKSMIITQGESRKITIKYKKKKAKYKYIVSNKKISVSATGKVKGLKVGKTKVMVKEKYKNKTRSLGTVTVTVKKGQAVQPTKKPEQTSAPTTEPTEEPASTTNPDVSEPTPEPTKAPTESVVYKNQFEDGNLNGFGARGSSSVEVSNSQNHTEGGMNSLYCKDRSATWHGVSLPISKYVSTGENYKFSAWVKQDTGTTEKISMKLEYKDKNGDSQYKSVVAGADDGLDCENGKWVELAGEYKIPDYDGDISLYLEAPNSETMDFLVDDVVIVGKPVKNQGFEMTDEIYQQMLKDSVLSTGNNARIKKVIEKARAGEEVSLAYIGGSITEGALATPNANCYAQASATAFAQKYGKDGGANVHCINAGMSGTPSDIGVVRYNRDVIGRLPSGDHPDILFIEFAVNDYGCVTGGGGYEGLIRQALKSGSAVVLVFAVFQGKAGGRVCENEYRPYGEYYDLPMISMGDAIMGYFKKTGFYNWYFGDTLHPNNTGHKLMADCIMKLMDRIDKEKPVSDNITNIDEMAPKKTAAYQGIKLIDSATDVSSDEAIKSIDAGGFTEKDSATGNFQYEYKGMNKAPWFPDNWKHTSASGNESLKINVNCKTLMLVYKQSSETSFGAADLYIDGVKKETLNCYNASGWNNGTVYVALTTEKAEEHKIELKMADGNESKNFTLLAIGYN